MIDNKILYIKLPNEENYEPIGCLNSHTFNEDCEYISTVIPKKNTFGFTGSRATLQSYEINFIGLIDFDYLYYNKLEGIKRNKTLIDWKIEGQYGSGYLSIIQNVAEVENYISFEGNLLGFGQPYYSEDVNYLNYDLNFNI